MHDDAEIAVLLERDAENERRFQALVEEDADFHDWLRRRYDGLSYRTTCPNCGGMLRAVALEPDTAPWLCEQCHLGFWSAELSDEARGCYKPPLVEFIGRAGARVRRAMQLEHLQAHQRGCSLRTDQLVLVPDEALARLPARWPRLHADFAAAIRAEIERKG